MDANHAIDSVAHKFASQPLYSAIVFLIQVVERFSCLLGLEVGSRAGRLLSGLSRQ